jgi:hypothetical protein
VPVTATRVAETNRVIDQFTNQFFATNGRLPTRQELMAAFTSKTLAVPLVAGTAMNALMPDDY